MEATCAVQEDFIIPDEFLSDLTQGEQEEEVEHPSGQGGRHPGGPRRLGHTQFLFTFPGAAPP